MTNFEARTASTRPILCYLTTGVLGLFSCLTWIFGSFLDGPYTATHVIAPFIFLIIAIGAMRADWREGRDSILPVSLIVAGITLVNIFAIIRLKGLFDWSQTFSILWLGPTLASLLGVLIGMGASRWLVRIRKK